MFKWVKELLAKVVKSIKKLFTPATSKKEEPKVAYAVHINDNIQVEDTAAAEEAQCMPEGKYTKENVPVAAKVVFGVLTYVAVVNFPLTILIIMEAVAVYGVLNTMACWIANNS